MIGWEHRMSQILTC